MICPEPSELQELVRELHRQATPWLPAGLASRLAWGPAIQTGADQACPDQQEPLVLSTAKLNRIVAYSPGDFTITVAAGTPLVAVQQELAQQRQWLSLDWPWGSGLAGHGSGSLGGLVARGLAGGYRQRYLGVRDQLIGIGLLRADGTAARAGGRVVKNVAGYDLMRLLCGSWGSLALITEVTLRTQPLPPQRRSLWLQGPLPQLTGLARWILDSSLSPERLDWVQHAPAQAPLGLLVGLASISGPTLEEQLACIRARADDTGIEAAELDPEAQERLLVAVPPAPDWLLHLGVPASHSEALLAGSALGDLPVVLGAGSGLGVAWAAAGALPAHRVVALRQQCQGLGGHLTVLRQPAGAGLLAWLDAPARPVIQALKRQFDPKQQLARGRLPGVAG